MESFILRAINANVNFTNRDKIFVIANFQKLNLNVQIEAFTFLKK